MALNYPPPPPLQFIQADGKTVSWNWQDWFQRLQTLAGHLDSITVPASIMSVGLSGVTNNVANITLIAQAINTVFAGPTSGSPGVPTFRSLVTADLPSSLVGSQAANTFFAAPDGSAGVPSFRRIVPTDYEWGMVKKSVDTTESMTIPSGFQLTAHRSFTVTGTVILSGELWIDQTTPDGQGIFDFRSFDNSSELLLL